MAKRGTQLTDLVREALSQGLDVTIAVKPSPDGRARLSLPDGWATRLGMDK